jgi:nitrite reductase (NADH) large subunit
MEIGGSAWRCDNCGYVHRGPTPPESCPVCGAPANEFSPYVEPAPVPVARAARWRCLNCQYLHDGPEPPAECPVCGALADQFEPAAEPAGSAGTAGPGRRAGAFRAVVVGGGIAGLSAAEAIRAAAPEASVVLVTNEPSAPYYRLNLTRYLAGEVTAADLPLHDEAWYADQRIEVRTSCRTESLDLEARRVNLDGGESVPYDRLVIATGAHPFVPPIPGAETAGVVTLRTREDAEGILSLGRRGDPVVVIGGGVLGLETAGALARRGAAVTVLEGFGWLMPRQLNREAAEFLARHVAGLGITLRHGARVSGIEGARRVEAVALADGTRIPAGLVILAAGVRPNTHLARRAGMTVNQGIVVDNHLAASAPDVYAAGDAAEHAGILYGTWAPSQFQGSIAGMNAAGAEAVYGGQPRSNTLKVLGIELLSIGLVEPPDGSYVAVDEGAGDCYQRFILRDGALVGAILVGDVSGGPAVKAAVEGRLDYGGLLLARPTAAEVLAHAAQSFGISRRR